MPSMRCPDCGAGSSAVIDSRLRKNENTIRRRRRCRKCDSRWTTTEVKTDELSDTAVSIALESTLHSLKVSICNLIDIQPRNPS